MVLGAQRENLFQTTEASFGWGPLRLVGNAKVRFRIVSLNFSTDGLLVTRPESETSRSGP